MENNNGPKDLNYFKGKLDRIGVTSTIDSTGKMLTASKGNVKLQLNKNADGSIVGQVSGGGKSLSNEFPGKAIDAFKKRI